MENVTEGDVNIISTNPLLIPTPNITPYLPSTKESTNTRKTTLLTQMAESFYP